MSRYSRLARPCRAQASVELCSRPGRRLAARHTEAPRQQHVRWGEQHTSSWLYKEEQLPRQWKQKLSAASPPAPAARCSAKRTFGAPTRALLARPVVRPAHADQGQYNKLLEKAAAATRPLPSSVAKDRGSTPSLLLVRSRQPAACTKVAAAGRSQDSKAATQSQFNASDVHSRRRA